MDLAALKVPDLVTLQCIKVRQWVNQCKVSFRFGFATPVIGEVTIGLRLVARDDDGKELCSASTVCSDARQFTERVEMFGHMVAGSPVNSSTFYFPGINIEDIDSIDVELIEIR